MQLNKIELENFRKFKKLEVQLKAGVNILIGDNASGKTSILEAISIIIGSFFSGINSRFAISPSISPTKDVSFIKNKEGQLSRQYPTKLRAQGTVFDKEVIWNRELNSAKGATTKSGLSDLKVIIAENCNKKDLPVLAYYSTTRLQSDKNNSTSYKKDEIFEAYQNALNAKTSVNKFIKWFENEDRISYQNKSNTFALDIVSEAIKHCIPDCKRVYYDARLGEIVIQNLNKEITLFSLMSDGYKMITSLVGDLSYRCSVLNAHLKEKCLRETKGVVIIDEIETHLHPSWQQNIINELSRVFPKIQFVISTHSPIVLSAAKANVIGLDNNHSLEKSRKIYAYGRNLENIMVSEQGVYPRLSSIQNQIDRFYELIESKAGLEEAERILKELFVGQFGESDPETIRAISDYELAKIEFKEDH
ncbi:MAG: AAA family ATPase [Bacteroidales bacterium]